MPLTGSPNQRKKQVFQEFKAGTLHSGKGKPGRPAPLVKNKQQAVAIALSAARRAGARGR